MTHTKVSLSLPATDVAFLDAEIFDGRYPSRSAAVQDAVRLLGESCRADAYAQANDEGYDRAWDTVAGDGLASGSPLN